MSELNHLYIGKLVAKAQNEDSDAFAELYAQTYQKVYQYACRYLRNPDLAQDAVQEVYILALRNLEKLKDGTLFVAWLNQIAFHVCFDLCKKRDRQYDEISPELLELSADEYEDHNPELKMLRANKTEVIREAISRLSSYEQQVIVMKYLNDMKLEDIAKALSCSRSSVKRYLISAKEHLLGELKTYAIRKEADL